MVLPSWQPHQCSCRFYVKPFCGTPVAVFSDGRKVRPVPEQSVVGDSSPGWSHSCPQWATMHQVIL